ncbi:MAG: winged helix-turn-helix domain-containing protein, partial [Myxococcota bacterium]
MNVLELIDRKVDLVRHKVWHGDEVTPLTDQEAALLAYLAERPGRAVPREELLAQVWGYAEAVVTRAVDAAVRRLRSKIEADPSDPNHLLTVHSVGYRFEAVNPPPEVERTTAVVVIDIGDGLLDLDTGLRKEVADLAFARLDDLAGRHGGLTLLETPEVRESSFALPLSAARFALAVARTFAEAPWPEAFLLRARVGGRGGALGAKIGVHPSVRAEARRLSAAAWPGQVLTATGWLVDDADLRAIAVTRDGSAVGLVDVTEVVELRDVTLADRHFPDRRGPRVPSAVNRFVGRRVALGTLGAAMDEHGLVTLTGPAGVGKTRLATELARRWDREGRVWLCELAPASTLEELVQIVADRLGVPARGADLSNAIDAVGLAMAGRGPQLVVLDNFDAFADDASVTVGAWRALAAEMTFLVTSRTRLDLAGEHVIEVPPLELEEAIDLFETRAPSDAVLAGDDRELVARLVAHVDRLPLAIELAASRTRTLAPLELLEHLQRSTEARFAVL